MFDLISRRRWFFLFSGLITIPGLIFILLTPITAGKVGIQFSIDYTGGTVWEVHFKNGTPSTDQVKQVLDAQGLSDSSVTTSTQNGLEYILMRLPVVGLQTPEPTPTPPPSAVPSTTATVVPTTTATAVPSASAAASATPSPAASGSAGASAGPTPSPSPSPTPSPTPSPSPSPSPSLSPSPSPTPFTGITGTYQPPTGGQLGALATALQARFGPIDGEIQRNSISGIVSNDLIQQAFLLIILGSIGILAWITIRFHDFRMGATALIALLHDVIVVVGTFAILGTIFGLQVDALFVTAVLTVIGFSVHDTIVVFDRIRENRARHAGEPFDAIVNHSLLQTMGRSINTSLTVIITLTALLLFGGESIRVFVLALLIGIVSGTYSSIFNASPLLVVWHAWDDRRRARTAALARASH